MVKIFCDGSGGKIGTAGAWAIAIRKDHEDSVLVFRAGNISTSINRMELTATLRALEWLKDNNEEGEIVVDSQYVSRGVNEFMDNWKKMNFVFTKNSDLWKQVNKLIHRDKVKFKIYWIRGHQKNLDDMDVLGNHIVDLYAGMERRRIVTSLHR